MWVLFLKLIDDEYQIMQAGYNLVPTQVYDKVIPTTEKVVRNVDKVYFDGTKLKVIEGETLDDVEDLKVANVDVETEPVIYDVEV
ncbi:hypothetical protein [Staphylococcus haemolyticus]|uniref:hypothetical protein n=1 Tax=Staphylococcus haemolyticus TaxID=1283 RepID=UPI002903A914|nr:hypothetical protein [Staphylococcus haemolyticus]MDU0439432.1 hypothetical protein [Staphylococcus haemolyticus]